MQISLRGVSVDGRREPMLERVDLEVAEGECVLLAAEPGHGHTALALVATGRLRPFEGAVELVDGRRRTDDPRRLRAATAVVDVPGVSEPEETLPVTAVVAEGLALAGRRSLPGDVRRWVEAHGLAEHRATRVDQLHGAVRTGLLAALAAEREGVRFLVLTLPDRHAGEPGAWWAVAESFAQAGLGVLVQGSRSSARDLGADLPPARGRTLHAAPVVALRTRPAVATPSSPDDAEHEPQDTESRTHPTTETPEETTR